MRSDNYCPCGSGRPVGVCCAPYVDGRSVPETAEQLMRSRYTAYVLGRLEYLRDTWHPTTRRDPEHGEPVTWLGLKIVRTEAGDVEDNQGTVEFVARYKVGGKAHRLHEISRFRRRDGRWLYVDGETGPTSR
jgi:SEC-C motif-containing protein